MARLVWLFVAFVVTAAPALADIRVALIVANGAYHTAPLSNPSVDAAMVEAALKRLGFKTSIIEDVKIDDFEAALFAFAQQAKGADVALFYYAGHGFAVSDRGGSRNFLMGVDADVTTSSERALRAFGLPLDDVVSAISEMASTTLIFIDACRNDPSISRAVGGRGRSAVPVDRTVGENVLVGLSTRLGDVAADGEPGKGSPFARAFSANIGKAGIRVDDAFTQARKAVMGETNGQQRPDIGRYDLETPLVLLPERILTPSTVDVDHEEELTAYEQASEVGSCGALKAFGRRYPKSFYAELAGERAKVACAEANNIPTADDSTQSAPKEATHSPPSASHNGAKFTQRLSADGTEVDAGKGSAFGGMSVAAMSRQGERSPDREVPLANPVDTSQVTPEHAKAIFYEERTDKVAGSAEPGFVEWSSVQESPGGNLPPEAVIRAEVTFPGKDVRLRMTIKRNADQALPASHFIELIFLTPSDFPGGAVDDILRIAMKGSEQEAGDPLIGVPSKIADGFFLVGLNSEKDQRRSNLEIMAEGRWIDIPIVYGSGRRALVSIEKGASGLKAFNDVFSDVNNPPG